MRAVLTIVHLGHAHIPLEGAHSSLRTVARHPRNPPLAFFLSAHVPEGVQTLHQSARVCTQPGLVYLRGLSTDKVFSLTIERVPHTENVVRPLTFALELSVAEAAEDLFMLRVAGE